MAAILHFTLYKILPTFSREAVRSLVFDDKYLKSNLTCSRYWQKGIILYICMYKNSFYSMILCESAIKCVMWYLNVFSQYL